MEVDQYRGEVNDIKNTCFNPIPMIECCGRKLQKMPLRLKIEQRTTTDSSDPIRRVEQQQ